MCGLSGYQIKHAELSGGGPNSEKIAAIIGLPFDFALKEFPASNSLCWSGDKHISLRAAKFAVSAFAFIEWICQSGLSSEMSDICSQWSRLECVRVLLTDVESLGKWARMECRQAYSENKHVSHVLGVIFIRVPRKSIPMPVSRGNMILYPEGSHASDVNAAVGACFGFREGSRASRPFALAFAIERAKFKRLAKTMPAADMARKFNVAREDIEDRARMLDVRAIPGSSTRSTASRQHFPRASGGFDLDAILAVMS
jgi:hypothetical protein